VIFSGLVRTLSTSSALRLLVGLQEGNKNLGHLSPEEQEEDQGTS